MTLSLRPATPGDREFLIRVYGSTRLEELAAVEWDDRQKDAFIRMQFDAQDQYYRANYLGAEFLVVEWNGEPAGRLYLCLWPNELRIMDIALLPDYRGLGIGSTLLDQTLVRYADRAVTIHVERYNRALSLYHRLGFELVEDKGVYLFLRRAAIGEPLREHENHPAR